MALDGADAVDVLVIGAGVSGLTAAHLLERQGVRVAVLETAARTGGVIGTKARDNALVETGPNSALDASPLIDELLTSLAIRGERVEANAVAATRYIVREGKLVALPVSPSAFLTTSAFSLGAKLRLAREPFIAPAPAGAEESIAGFVRRRLGAEFLDYAVDPFVSGVYAGDPERISVAAAFPRLFALEQGYGSLIKGQIRGAKERKRNPEAAKNTAGSFSFRAGMQTLTDALVRSLARVETGFAVERIARGTDGVWVVTGRRAGEPVTRHARAIVVAVPAYTASALAREFAPAAARGLGAIEYAPVASIAVAYRRADIAHPLAGFGFLVPKRERRSILGTLFSSSMFDGRAPEGTVLLTSFLGGMRQPGLPAQSDAALVSLLHAELTSLVGARGEPLWAETTRWTHAIPQYNLGHAERLLPVEAAERDLPGIFFRANYRGGVSVGDCIKSAHVTAHDVRNLVAGTAAPR